MEGVTRNLKRGVELAKAELTKFWKDEDGMGSVEIILIIVVLVGLVLIFRGQVTKLVEGAFKQIKGDNDKIVKSNKITGGFATED